MKTPSLWLAVLLSACAHTASSHEPHRRELDQLVERFRSGIIAKDGAALRELFVAKGAPWPAVMHLPRPTQAKVREVDTPETFIDFIVTSPDQLEETIRNLQVVTDGDIASVTFDYEFVSNSQVVNRGLECWHVVHSETGWKIAFIAYSIVAP